MPTFLNNLYTSKAISSEVVSVYFSPESGSNTKDVNGELTFGGTDPSKYTGKLSYFPLGTTEPYSNYWSVAVSGVAYGKTALAGPGSAIIDTVCAMLFASRTLG